MTFMDNLLPYMNSERTLIVTISAGFEAVSLLSTYMLICGCTFHSFTDSPRWRFDSFIFIQSEGCRMTVLTRLYSPSCLLSQDPSTA